MKFAILLAAAAVMATPSAVFARGESGVTTPTLRLASIRPLFVRGSTFRHGERVRVTVTQGSHSWTKRAVASRTGSFSLDFGPLPVTRCGLVARAFGSAGSKASTKPAEPACPEPIGPISP